MATVNSPVVRFAPSPTGRLHVGNLRTAVLNWLYARKHGGRFILRLDDTDLERSEAVFEQAIRDDLTWLGLVWDRQEKQSLRTARYAEVAEELKSRGLVYPCTETEDELDRQRKRRLARGEPPVYVRAHGEKLRSRHEGEGRRPYWRFALPSAGERRYAHWDDGVRGPQRIDLAAVSDPVIARADGTFLYTFTSVVDDADFGVTQVIRGEDHVTNTGVQLALFAGLGASPPAFAHHSLIVAASGEALSKRSGALSLGSLRDDGLEAMAVLSLASLIGTSDAVAPHASVDELVALFDLSKLSRAPARFDVAELEQVNAKLLHRMPFATVADRLGGLGIGGGAAFFEAVRGNLVRLRDAVPWWAVVSGAIEPVIEDPELCAAATGLLPPEPWTVETWGALTTALRQQTGRKGRALFHPLRLALTGRDTGPEMTVLLPLIGRAKVSARLAGDTA